LNPDAADQHRLVFPEHVPSAALAPERRTLVMSVTRTIEYEVRHVKRPVFDLGEHELANLVGSRQVLLVVDTLVWQRHGAAIEAYASLRLDCLDIRCIGGLESDKTLEAASALCAAAAQARLPRDGVFIGVGGGVVLDVTGFAAAMYRRGVPFVRVPTTLVGLIDVSVGIKHAVNFGGKKNLLGAFYPPLGSINDSSFLATLPPRHIACGLAEIVKIGLACDAELFTLVERFGATLLASSFRTPSAVADEVLLRAEYAMMSELAPNLFETTLRRPADFGHTFSPLLEVASNYELAHGEAVALDMLVSTAIAIGRGLCDPVILVRLLDFYRDVGLPTAHPQLAPELLLRAAAETREHRGGHLNLVVPTAAGATAFIQEVEAGELGRAIASLAKHARRREGQYGMHRR
jgi:3-dehydroquinate synthase